MGLDRVDTINIVNGAITNAKLANASVAGSNICDTTINTNNIVNGAITNAKLANASVAGSNICNETIDTSKFLTMMTGDIRTGVGHISTCQGNIYAEGSGGSGGCINGVYITGACCVGTDVVNGCCINGVYITGACCVGTDGDLYGYCFRLGDPPSLIADGNMKYCTNCLMLYYNGTCYCFIGTT